MNDGLSGLLEGFDCGRLSRRQLLRALGVTLALPSAVLAAPAGPGTQQARSGTRAKLPFKPTGWKTVLLDHLSCRVENHDKEAAFYNALMNWAVRSNNGGEAVLDIGDWSGLVIRGGYRLSAAEAAADRAQNERAAAQALTKGFKMGPFVPRNAVFDNICWGIEPWNAREVEAALKARGLNPVSDNRGHDFESFHVKDPDGFDVQISNGNRRNRRRMPARGKLVAPFAHTDWKTIWLDHISYTCPDHEKTVAFYQALLGWEPKFDLGNTEVVRIGDVGDAYIRNYAGSGSGVTIDHISFGITPFDPKLVKAALEKRGLPATADTGGGGPIDTSGYKSYHTLTPSGFDLQISNVSIATREVGL